MNSIKKPFGRIEWEAKLTAKMVGRLLAYDQDTGLFHWRVSRRGVTAGEQAGTIATSGYVVIGFDGRRYRAHRLAFLLMTGAWPGQQVDHVDGDKKNNKWSNLRDVSAAVNSQNWRKAKPGTSTGLLGASWDPINRKYVSRIKVNGRSLNLGRFATPEEAHQAYVTAKRKYHEGCTL